jgi:hypothetical protein
MTARKKIAAASMVAEARGTWRWQDAYRIATYGVRRTRDGRLLWYSYSRSRKLSEPQVRREGWHYDTEGTLHHRPIEGDVLLRAYRRVRNHMGPRWDHWCRCVRRFVPGAGELLDAAAELERRPTDEAR